MEQLKEPKVSSPVNRQREISSQPEYERLSQNLNQKQIPSNLHNQELEFIDP